ncbi:peptidylprolyl isomerase [Alicyclobacillaceae bacterium I2511]|nr:peptidylprolyl isomerase [Alicyclobacillaceae bacterium I2511]
MKLQTGHKYVAEVQTTLGNFVLELFAETAPQTVNNFVFLAREGFYDGVVFHRIIRDFMVQTGDPTGTGMGGPGYRFADELPPVVPYAPGVVAMANAGPNTNGSQFFICTGNQSDFLNRQPNYSVFGRVSQGMDTVLKIASTPVGPGTSGENSTPLQTVKMTSVLIQEQEN